MDGPKITSEDIARAEKVLLGDGHNFNEEHVAFINDWSSLSVQACPGSGKTTSLLAKLLIIDESLPFSDNSGVLVLSHTNAAVNEIKRRIEPHCAFLFKYPNFVGTIQEFTDRFLALPFARSSMKLNVTTIDDSLYKEVLLNKFRAVKWSNDYGKIGAYLRARCMSEAQKKSSNDKQAKLIADDLAEDIIVNLYIDLADNTIKQLPYSNILLKSPSSPTYKGIKRLINEVHEQGIIPFHYAYVLALQYIQTHPQVGNLLRSRFKYMFVDEMQDMSLLQCQLLEALFEKSDGCTQYIGDNNQAIYSQAEAGATWKPGNNQIQINGTMRLSEPIAKSVGVLGVEPQTLIALAKRSSYKPVLIVFDDQNLLEVIPKFASLVYDYELHELSKQTGNPIKIIGWRTESLGNPKHLSLTKYSPNYKRSVNGAHPLNNLLDIFDAIPIKNSSGKVVSKLLMTSILTLLKSAKVKDENGKYFNQDNLQQYLETTNPNLVADTKFMINHCEQMISQGHKSDAAMEWEKFLKDSYCKQFKIPTDGVAYELSSVSGFFNYTELQNNHLTNEQSADILTNQYQHIVDGNPVFTADICTIHSVKGETHTATLYLETCCYSKHDSERILKILAGDRADADKPQTIMNMKMAYVGMTRPTDFLCFAVHAERIDSATIDALKDNWDIEYLVA